MRRKQNNTEQNQQEQKRISQGLRIKHLQMSSNNNNKKGIFLDVKIFAGFAWALWE